MIISQTNETQPNSCYADKECISEVDNMFIFHCFVFDFRPSAAFYLDILWNQLPE